MKDSFWERISIYFAPALLLALGLFSLALTYRDGDEFPQSSSLETAPHLEPLANLQRLDANAQDFFQSEIALSESVPNYLAYKELQEAVYQAGRVLPATSCLAVKQGEIELYIDKAPIGLRPASGQKIATALVALIVLGPEYTYTTQIRANAEPQDGVLDGNLYLIGSGDPYLWTEDYYDLRRGEANGIVHTPLEELAQQLLDDGLVEITGRVAGVETRYDSARYPPSWPKNFTNDKVSGKLSALSVNQSYLNQGDSWSTSDSPAEGAAAVFDDLLEAEGVIIPRSPLVSSLLPPVVLAEITSPPLKETIHNILGVSDNTASELLLKEIGLTKGHPGSTELGVEVLVEVLTELGIYAADDIIFPTDGSGVAEEHRSTCRELLKLLEYSEENYAITESLARAGESGTLGSRFLDSPAKGRLYAKTGSWVGIFSLSGYVKSDDGQEVSFSYISNDTILSILSEQERVELEDSIATALVNYLNRL